MPLFLRTVRRNGEYSSHWEPDTDSAEVGCCVPGDSTPSSNTLGLELIRGFVGTLTRRGATLPFPVERNEHNLVATV